MTLPTITEPLHHIRRDPLPWTRRPALTECGRRADELSHVITRDEAVRKFNELGRQRFSLFICQTCMHTTTRWRTWNEDPIDRLARELHRHRERETIQTELRAIAELVNRHKEEFDGLVDGISTLPNLADRRAQKKGLRRR